MAVTMNALFNEAPLGNFKQQGNGDWPTKITAFDFEQKINGEVIVKFNALANIYAQDWRCVACSCLQAIIPGALAISMTAPSPRPGSTGPVSIPWPISQPSSRQPRLRPQPAQAASCSPPRSPQRPWPVTGGGDSHIASQWQIASDEAFTRIVDDSSKASDLASHALTKPLDPVSCNLAQWQDRACQNTRRPCRGGKKRA